MEPNTTNELKKIERQNDYLLDALEGIECDNECLHTPDKLYFIEITEDDYGIVQYFQCSCDKKIKEIYTSSNRIAY